jgi:hypothetical protein
MSVLDLTIVNVAGSAWSIGSLIGPWRAEALATLAAAIPALREVRPP